MSSCPSCVQNHSRVINNISVQPLKHWTHHSLIVSCNPESLTYRTAPWSLIWWDQAGVCGSLSTLMDEGLKASQMIDLDWNMSAELLPELTAQHNGDVYKDLYVWMHVWQGKGAGMGKRKKDCLKDLSSRGLWCKIPKFLWDIHAGNSKD